MKSSVRRIIVGATSVLSIALLAHACTQQPGQKQSVLTGDAASRVYVAPGSYDEFYSFMSGGFSGQVAVYGLPSGRLLKVIPVFSQNAENGWGYNEETKPMLETTFGFIPWDDTHHTELSMTDGVPDGRWLFINGNNTPRIARIDLTRFETDEILQIPNAAGGHASPFTTPNTKYVVSATRFSVPVPNTDVPIESYKQNFKGTLSFIKADQPGKMDIAFQILMPGYNYDLGHAGKGPSDGWFFFTSYNSEQANSKLETNASQNDKDYIAAVNYAQAEQCVAQGKAKAFPSSYTHNWMDESTRSARTETKTSVKMLDPRDCPGIVYYLPTPKSPHGVDVDPTGEYIVAGGKLASVIPVHSFSKMKKAIDTKAFDGELSGIPILKYDAVIAGEVQKPGLGPLHTEFDGKGYAYTSMFISSEVVKWKLGTWEVVDRIPTYYSIGHLMIPGGDSKKPWGKYLVAMNKITKDRYLPTGPEMAQSAQLFDISGDKMKLLLDFPTIGEPHYAQAIPASMIKDKQVKFYELAKNTHPNVTKAEANGGITREGNRVHVKMIAIRSHFAPDNLEGVTVGDTVFFHVTNIEQDWDILHGFAVLGATNSELILNPGETRTLKWVPKTPGVYPFYCTDFCSALHQEMSGYIRVSAPGSTVKLSANISPKAQAQLSKLQVVAAHLPSAEAVTDMKAGKRGHAMMTRTPRLLIALSALLLGVAFATPIWRINLVAPQYPEGLGMLIRIDTITGIKPADLNNINGLNHYIGMKAIEPGAIPVLDVMPIALGVLIAVGLLVALYGRRWAAWSWLGLVAAAGAAGMIEFWRWSYDYGHNLAPDAIIKVPGMTYQPPLIGTKQLLNFTAASWPDVGAVAAGLAFAIGVVALVLSRPRDNARVKGITAAVAAAAGLMLALIAAAPVKLSAQKDSAFVSPGGASLSDAIASVKSGGIVVVLPGHYMVGEAIIGKPVTIVGRGYPVLDGGGKGGILKVTAENVTIDGLRLTGTGVSYTQDRAAIRVTAVGGCRIINNRIDSSLYAIYLAKATSCEIANNDLRGSGLTEATSGNGIHLWSARGIRIDNNRINGFRDGIYFEFVHDTQVTRNVSERNLRYGLHFMYSDDCNYVGNVFRQNGAGVAVMYTKRVHMTRNRFEKNWGSSAYGLLLKEIADSRIENNVFEANTTGLYADGADRIQAIGNDFSRNGWAVKVGGSTLNGFFSQNNFTDNTFDVTTNSRDPSTKFAGNYWNSYKGYDLNRDGVGDIPHAPVRLFAVILERTPQAIVLMRSALVSLLDAAERAMPSLTPELFVDPSPSMKRLG